jgi:transcriptional regulator with XRE-family HTH domain
MDLKRRLGQAVRHRRMELGLTQAELAERMTCDVLQSDISRIERGYLPWPRPDLLYGLAAALSMSPLQLVMSSGWMSEEEYQHYRSLRPLAAEKPLALLGPARSDDGLACSANTALNGRFCTLTAFDGGALLESIVSQDCPRVRLKLVETIIQNSRFATNVIVVGHRRATVPRDLRFHYLKAPATSAALESLLGAIGYGGVAA